MWSYVAAAYVGNFINYFIIYVFDLSCYISYIKPEYTVTAMFALFVNIMESLKTFIKK